MTEDERGSSHRAHQVAGSILKMTMLWGAEEMLSAADLSHETWETQVRWVQHPTNISPVKNSGGHDPPFSEANSSCEIAARGSGDEKHEESERSSDSDPGFQGHDYRVLGGKSLMFLPAFHSGIPTTSNVSLTIRDWKSTKLLIRSSAVLDYHELGWFRRYGKQPMQFSDVDQPL